jgi:hypothetical protein
MLRQHLAIRAERFERTRIAKCVAAREGPCVCATPGGRLSVCRTSVQRAGGLLSKAPAHTDAAFDAWQNYLDGGTAGLLGV